MIDFKNSLQDYVEWAATMWAQNQGELEIRDWAIMALGLGGEIGEVLEVLEQAQASGLLDRDSALKEMGDAFYYWCRIVHAFGFDSLRILGVSDLTEGVGVDAVSRRLSLGDPAKPHEEALALSSRAGVVQELCKKLIRDGKMDKEKLFWAMRATGHAWFRLARSLGLTPSRILAANVAKLSGRLERGTLRGSGNDR